MRIRRGSLVATLSIGLIAGLPLATTTAEAESTAIRVASQDKSEIEEIESKALGGAIEQDVAALRPE